MLDRVLYQAGTVADMSNSTRTTAPHDHTADAVASDTFVFGLADGTVAHRAADIDHASAWAVDNLTLSGSGIAVFTPTGSSIPAGHFLLLARKMIRLRGKVASA